MGRIRRAALYACGFSVRTIADATGRGVKAVRAALVRADVTLRPPGAARHLNGAKIAALPAGPAADIAHTLLAREAQARAASRPWDLADGVDGWESVLAAAVEDFGRLAVTDAVTRQLGRRPTRLEAAAALRAAHRLSDRGELHLQQLSPPDGGRQQWVISRPADLHADHRPGDVPARTASTDPAGVADRLLRHLRRVQEVSKRMEPERIPPETAQRLAAAIEATQADLATVSLRLGSARSRPSGREPASHQTEEGQDGDRRPS